jgi:paraquat-inducible protein B
MSELISPGLAAASVTRRRMPSLIWLVPIVAVAIGLWLVVHAWLEQGPVITIRFKSAEGIEAGKTKIRYKEVEIGELKAIGIAEDRKTVIVTAQMNKDARDLLKRDSRFFVIRPRISGGTVSGLSTLLSGAYIALEPGSAPETAKSFAGLETPPVVTGDAPGREFVLRGEQLGSLDYGTPVFYRRVKVGHVTRYSLNQDGGGVEVGVFIDAPHDRFVTANTRFWHASGVDISIDASGFKISTQSLASIIEGGIAFQELSDLAQAAAPAPAGTSFTLHTDRAQALQPPDQHKLRFVAYFPESLRGLSVGAPVDFRGIVIGEVKALGVEYDKAGGPIRFPVAVDVYPDRLRSRSIDGSAPGPYSDAQSNAIIDQLIARGLRAQLRSANLLTGQLYVALDFFPEAKRTAIDRSHKPAVVPTMPGGLTQLQETIARIARRVDRIPVDELSADLGRSLKSLDATLKSSRSLIDQLDAQVAPQATRALAEAEQALRSANEVLAQDSPLQTDVHDALGRVAQAARALTILADYLERHPESIIVGKAKETR